MLLSLLSLFLRLCVKHQHSLLGALARGKACTLQTPTAVKLLLLQPHAATAPALCYRLMLQPYSAGATAPHL